MDRRFKPNIYYGWIVLAACFVAAEAYGLFYTLGVFFRTLESSFGWSRTLISSFHSLHIAVAALSGLLVGWLTDKYGPKLAVALCAFLMGSGFALCGRIETVGDFYLAYGIASLGVGVSLTIPLATAQRWFVKHRGLALGIVSSGIGGGGLIIPPITNMLIEAVGWRKSYLILGLSVWVALMSVSLVIVSDPEKKGLLPYGADEGESTDLSKEEKKDDLYKKADHEWTLAEAVKTGPLYVLAFLWFVGALPVHMMLIHIVPFAVDMGISDSAASLGLGLMAGISIVGRIGGGSMADKIGWKKSLFIFFAFSGIFMSAIIIVKSTAMLYVIVICFGISYGARIPALPGLAGHFFGTKSLALILAVVGLGACGGGLIGPLFAGFIFDTTQSYHRAFIIGALVCWLGILPLPFVDLPEKPASLSVGTKDRRQEKEDQFR